jgi:glycerate dehydrogenase
LKVVFVDFASLHPDDLDTAGLHSRLAEVKLWPDTQPQELLQRLAGAQVAVINKLRLDAATLRALPDLKLVCLAATGTDNVDLDAARELNIAVSNLRDYCTHSVVQHVFALILALNQNLGLYREAARSGAWQASGQFCLFEAPIRELHGKTLGVIGLGALGGGVAGVARAFGMRVIAARLPWRLTQPAGASGQSAPRVPLEELLEEADVISLHCPLTAETHKLINAEALQRMRPTALLINTARGGLVDSVALVDALRQGRIGGAGIDVLTKEPPDNDDVLLACDLPNLIVTPHIAWSAREARQRALDEIVANIVAFASGKERNRVC